jgi:polar amino acid transport system permease protein
MAYQFDFIPVLENANLLLRGAMFTLELTAIGTLLGVSLGIVGAAVRAWKIQPFSAIFGVYVELIRNTPFLVQLVINLGAYSTEIIRAGIQAISRGQMEASAALAMTRFETFRHVVLVPALGKVWPALSSQIIIVMLGSAVCSQIATEELSFAANFIQSRNFRAFETYIVTTLIYLCMALLIRQLLAWVGRRYIARSR